MCSIESSISAASGSAATVGANRIKISHDHVRYRIRTVDEYIADTCAAAAKINDKLEHHGTQYPSYDCKSLVKNKLHVLIIFSSLSCFKLHLILAMFGAINVAEDT